jgi:hypothetical protein
VNFKDSLQPFHLSTWCQGYILSFNSRNGLWYGPSSANSQRSFLSCSLGVPLAANITSQGPPLFREWNWGARIHETVETLSRAARCRRLADATLLVGSVGKDSRYIQPKLRRSRARAGPSRAYRFRSGAACTVSHFGDLDLSNVSWQSVAVLLGNLEL